MGIFSFLILLLFAGCSASSSGKASTQKLSSGRSPCSTSANNAKSIVASGDTIHTVWEDARAGYWGIYYKRSTNGGATWCPDIRLSKGSVQSYSPSIAAFGSKVDVVWVENQDENAKVIYVSSLNGGDIWGPVSCIDDSMSGAELPSIAVSDSCVYIVWVDMSDKVTGKGKVCFRRSWDNGLNWGRETCLTPDTAESILPSIAVSGSKVHVVWADARDGKFKIYYRASSDSGVAWGPEVRLTNDTFACSFPSLAVTGSNVHIVWVERSYVYTNKLFYKRSTDEGQSWCSDTQLSFDRPWSTNPSIAVSASTLHLLWIKNGNGIHYSQLFYKHSKDGGLTWSPDSQLTRDPIQSEYPSLAVSGSKGYIIWSGYHMNWSEYYRIIGLQSSENFTILYKRFTLLN